MPPPTTVGTGTWGPRFFVGAGWERPQWFEANAPLLTGAAWERGTAGPPATGRRSSAPSTCATRERAALFDLTPFGKFEVAGPGAWRSWTGICGNRIDVAEGRVVYTAMLTATGGIRCDLTVTRAAGTGSGW